MGRTLIRTTRKTLTLILSLGLALPYPHVALGAQTASGGGGAVPPIYPPTTYMEPGGSQPDPKNNPKPSSTQAAPRGFSSFSYHQQLTGGIKGVTFAEGVVDAQGRERVFRYLPGQTATVEVGVIERVSLKVISAQLVVSDYQIQWLEKVSIQSLGRQVTPPNLAIQLTSDGQSRHRAGEFFTFEGHSSPKRPVYFEGRLEGKNERVFQLNEKNPNYVRQGVVIRDRIKPQEYRIQWNSDYTSKHKFFHPQSAAVEQRVSPRAEALNFTSRAVENVKLLPHYPSGSTHSGSGQAEISSRYTEILPEFESRFRPTRLKKTLAWSQENYQEMAKKVERLKRGDLGLSEKIQSVKEAAPKVGTQALQIGGAVLAFYFALGILSAVKLNMDYGSDPRAWDQYTDTLKDPYGYLIFAGFIAGASSIYLARRVLGNVTGFRGAPGGPTFVLSLLGGAVAATMLSEVLYHPSFPKCSGLRDSGITRPDLKECDVIWDSFSKEKLADDLLPTLVSLSLAGGLFYGGAKLVSGLAQRQALAQVLSRATFYISKAPAAGPLLTGGKWILAGIFIIGTHELINDTLGLGKWVKDNQITSFSYQDHRYGQTVEENYQKLTDSWSLILGNRGVHDPKSEVGPLVLREALGRIQRFSELQKIWRLNQFQPTMQVYSSYVEKMNSFYVQVDTAHRFYYQVVKALKNEKATGRVILNDNFLSSLNEQLEENFVTAGWQNPDEFAFVETSTPAEHLITSMVCGPTQSGGLEKPSLMGSVLSWAKDYNSEGPRQMIENGGYSDVKFNPPRLTLTSDGSTSYCRVPGGTSFLSSSPKTPATQYVTKVNGENVQGLTQVLRAMIPQEWLNNSSMDDFQSWWTAHVTMNIQQVEREFRQMYRQVLTEQYFPVLNSNEIYKTFNAKDHDDLRTFRTALFQLSEGESRGNLHSLKIPYGLISSVREEIKTYLALLSDLEVLAKSLFDETSKKEVNQGFMDVAKRILDLQARIYDELNNLGEVRHERIIEMAMEYQSLEEELAAQVDSPLILLNIEGRLSQELLALRVTLFERLSASFKEIQSHVDVVMNFQDLASTPSGAAR